MLHERLKEHTRLHHITLEKTFIKGIQRLTGRADYASFLNVLYSFHSGSEDLLQVHLDHSRIPDFPERRRSCFLEEDLAALNGAQPVSTQCDTLPEIKSHSSALGVMYVLEGSTLGGRIVSKMIANRLQMSTGLRFFNGYGDRTEQMWDNFKGYLAQPFSGQEETEILSSAQNTFIGFNQWLEKNVHEEF